MEQKRQDLSQYGFVKKFVLPALLVYLVPAISLAFFLHARSTYDGELRESALKQVREDATLSEEERANALRFFEEGKFSELVKDPQFAEMVGGDIQFHYKVFDWMIWLSVIAIVTGIAVFLLAGLCVLLSLRSQQVQYVSLSVSWHVLRLFGALQTIIQGILLTALSFWVTALWFEMYSVKLVGLAGILALIAVALVIMAIFKRPSNVFAVQGEVIEKDSASPLWNDLQQICAKVGAAPPDQIVAGIDDSFFVTEQPVTVGEKLLTGRTLYVSLSLLKQLHGDQAAAVMSHELAHFSGQDTTYSKKISPLLVRYDHYLQALYEGGVTRPIFYFMLCFRALFELSLSRLSRQREFRADRIAADTTSPESFAGALLRIVAYSTYRRKIEEELFKREQALESANICEQIEQGFPAYAVSFTSSKEIGDLETTHPFDSHPPLSQRLEAIGVGLADESTRRLVAREGDGRWFQGIGDAHQRERQQWEVYEDGFRKFHEEVLAYRYLPANAEEEALVLKFFPALTYESKEGPLSISFEGIHFAPWTAPLFYREITHCELNDGEVLTISFTREGKQKHKLKMKHFGKQRQEVLQVFQRYYGRYLAAAEYQKQQGAAGAPALS